jgi:hypothetical protein
MPRPTAASSLPPGWLARCYLLRAADGVAAASVMYAVPLLILATTGSTVLTGLAFLLEWVPRLATIVGAGPIVDRHRAERVFALVATTRTVAALVTALGLVLLPHGAGTVLVLGFGVLSGMLTEVSFLTVEALGACACRQAPGRAHRIQTVQVGIDQAALLAGPLLGGVLLLAGPTVLLAVMASLSLLATATARTLPNNPGAQPGGGQAAGSVSPWAGLRTGCTVVLERPALGWLVTALAACGLVSGLLQVSAPITLTTGFGVSTAAAGAVWSIATAPSLIAIAAARRAIDRFGLFPVGLAGAGALSLAGLTAPIAASPLAYGAALAVLLAGEGVLSVVLRTARTRLIPQPVFASTLAVTLLAILAPLPLAGALVAALPAAGIPALVLACAIVQTAVTAVAFRGLWRHRAAYTHPTVAVPVTAVAEVNRDQLREAT